MQQIVINKLLKFKLKQIIIPNINPKAHQEAPLSPI